MLSPGEFSLVFRRYDDEFLEITPVVRERESSNPASFRPFQIWSCDDGESRVYAVKYWGDVAVTPVDWRRFAYDHDQVKELLARCIRDNWNSYLGAALSETVLVGLRAHLEVALTDLSTVFDVREVGCELEGGEKVAVSVAGEHKNGKREIYMVTL